MSTIFDPVMTVHEVSVEAIDDVVAIMEDAFDSRYGEAWNKAQCLGIMGLPNVWLAIARENGRPGGFALARIILDEAELLLIGVRPVFRKRGMGKLLLNYMTGEAVQRGASRIHLEVRDGNEAINLYDRSGFSLIGRRPSYYKGRAGQSFDALTLQRDLTAAVD